ncbi:hypothetical protein [Pontibacter silvestris]|nr:hypothetical protein [Pontibacter silvestris]MCC9135118.1 hypothetical protein [Pontibacter silvestris]
MPFEIKYESDFYRIEVDAANTLLRATWLRNVNDREMITGGTKLFEVCCDTKVERAIAYMQALGALNPEAKEWMSTKFYKLLSLTPLKKLARILPSSLFHRLSLESVVTRAEALGVTKFTVKNFVDQDQALEWLVE